ncbi:hypothetical protein T03_17777 [Trichinella britovi]|uniref:Uncharacterized protein n=1 Tax=Trichinella britovi TaxID=45882 RepID=A0A0V1CR16_TRIBR|nr:hypothetical protein T03_17777 [Trichinella britovi]
MVQLIFHDLQYGILNLIYLSDDKIEFYKKARQLYIEVNSIQNHNSICRFISNSFQGPHTLREILFIERLDKLPFIEWKRMTLRLKSYECSFSFLAFFKTQKL